MRSTHDARTHIVLISDKVNEYRTSVQVDKWHFGIVCRLAWNTNQYCDVKIRKKSIHKPQLIERGVRILHSLL